MLLTDDKEAAEKVEKYRRWVVGKMRLGISIEELGYNYRMSNVIAGVVQRSAPVFGRTYYSEKRNLYEI